MPHVQSHDRQKQRYQEHCSPLLGDIAGLDLPPVGEAEPVSLVTKASRSLFTSTCNVAYDHEDERKRKVRHWSWEALDRPMASPLRRKWTTQACGKECGQHVTLLQLGHCLTCFYALICLVNGGHVTGIMQETCFAAPPTDCAVHGKTSCTNDMTLDMQRQV